MSSMQLRIINSNYVRASGTIVTATTQDSGFPASNLQHTFRSKVWRSNYAAGYFKIDANNKYIDFKETAIGVEVTATLTEDEYTATTLATHIKAQMEAVTGVSATYTVSYSSSTGKWTISTDQAYLSLLWATGTNTANSVGSDLGFDTTSDDTGSTSYTGALIAIHSSHGERVTFDMGSQQKINSVSLFFDKIVGCKLTSSAVVKLQASNSDAWDSPDLDVTLSYHPSWDILTYYTDSELNYRYWSLNIIDPHNANLYVELGVVVMGYATQLELLPRNGFEYSNDDTSKIETTDYGHEYGDIYPIIRTLSIKYEGLRYTSIKKLDEIFNQVGSTQPVVVALDPTDDTFDNEHMTFYCKFKKNLSPSQLTRKFFEVDLEFREAM